MDEEAEASTDANGGRDEHEARGGDRAQRKDSVSGATPEGVKPDAQAMRAFITMIADAYREDNGLIEIAWDLGERGKKGNLCCAQLFAPHSVDAMVKQAMASNPAGHNVYVGPALRRPDAPRFNRTEDADTIVARVVWADFDNPGDLDAALTAFESVGALPNWITITGEIPHQRGQCFWLHEGAPLGSIRQMNSELIKRYRGDSSVKNVGRVMRLPGSVSWPRDKPGRFPELTRRQRERTRAAPYLFADLQRLRAPPHVTGGAAGDGTEEGPKAHANGAGMRSPHPHEAWAQAALERACYAVAVAPVGQRNSTLNREAYALGQIVGAGLLDFDEVERRLRDAACACGLDEAEINTILPRVVLIGMREPRGPPERADNATDDTDEDDKRASVADAIVAAAQGGMQRLFHDARQRAWAIVRIGKRNETVRVMSRRFETFLRSRYHTATEKTARAEALKQAAAHFETKAQFGGDTDEPRIRVAEHSGALLVDLADDMGRCVEITAQGWRALDEAPVPFYRPPGLRPLPEPERGGDLGELSALLNLRQDDEEGRKGAPSRGAILLCAWLLAALRPFGPYPVLVLRGPPGSAKTTAAEVIRSLIDPAKPQTRNLPDSERDLFIVTDAAHVIAVDNVSSISASMSDGLCRLSTGGGYATRALYTDGEETVFDAARPVILNGIGAFVTRGDLQDRCLVLELTQIPRKARRKKRTSTLPSTLHDRGCWVRYWTQRLLGCAGFRVCSWRKARAWPTSHSGRWRANQDTRRRARLCARGLRQLSPLCPTTWRRTPFAAAVVDLLIELAPGEGGARVWEGTVGELCAAVNPERKKRELPPTPKATQTSLERARPLLSRAGATVKRKQRSGRKRPYRLEMATEPSPSSQPSQGRKNRDGRSDGSCDGLGDGGFGPSHRPSPPEALNTRADDGGDDDDGPPDTRSPDVSR